MGFSLVESLVTLAIIAAMTGLMFQAVSTHARAAHYVAQKRLAIMLARSLLAQAALPPGAGELSETGRSKDMAWRFSRRPVDQGARDDRIPLEELRLDIVDYASRRQLVSVRTLRLTR